MAVAEEVDVKINEIESTEAQSSAVFEPIRRLVLASVGVVALTMDEIDSFLKRLVDRGEIAQKDAEKLLREVQSRLQRGGTHAEATAEKAESRFETSIEQVLNRLNIPTKRDIDELGAKIAQLTARVEELNRH